MEQPFSDLSLDGKKCFLLAPHCYLVKGAKRGALYNLMTGSVFSVDENAATVLECCESGMALEEVMSRANGIQPGQVITYLEQLTDAGLGDFYEKPLPFIEKLQPTLTLDQRRRRRFQWPVSYAFLELTTDCNLNCIFCVPGETQVRRSTECARWTVGTSPKSLLEKSEWLGVIDDLAWLGCSAIHFLGGEPLLTWELLVNLIAHAREKGIAKIHLTTNAMLLDDERISLLTRHSVHLQIQVFSNCPELHEHLTGCPGGYQMLIQNLKKLKQAGIPCSLNLLLTEETLTNQSEAMKYFQAFEPHQLVVDVLRPTDPRDGVRSELAPHLFRCEPNFSRTMASSFFERRYSHACWLGKVAVTATGDILPCIAARKELLGSCRQKGLKQMYRDRDFDPFWYFTIDEIETCAVCEYRYACFDCRPVAQGACGRLTAKNPYCTYDPMEGRWLSPQVHAKVSLPAGDEALATDMERR